MANKGCCKSMPASCRRTAIQTFWHMQPLDVIYQNGLWECRIVQFERELIFLQICTPEPVCVPALSVLANPISVMLLSMSLAVMLLIQEEMLESAVSRKSHCRDAQAGEGVLESLPPAEESCVPPCLAV